MPKPAEGSPNQQPLPNHIISSIVVLMPWVRGCNTVRYCGLESVNLLNISKITFLTNDFN